MTTIDPRLIMLLTVLQVLRRIPWRVFLSHTSDLRKRPAERSFVSAAEAAVSRAGHVIVDMAYFAASDTGCVEHCARMVENADVYVGIVGDRYGAPAHGLPDLSYTELEYELATRLGLPRLLFMIEGDALSCSPVNQSEEHRVRQEAFRSRLRDTGALIARVSSPAELEVGLLHSLAELGTN